MYFSAQQLRFSFVFHMRLLFFVCKAENCHLSRFYSFLYPPLLWQHGLGLYPKGPKSEMEIMRELWSSRRELVWAFKRKCVGGISSLLTSVVFQVIVGLCRVCAAIFPIPLILSGLSYFCPVCVDFLGFSFSFFLSSFLSFSLSFFFSTSNFLIPGLVNVLTLLCE